MIEQCEKRPYLLSLCDKLEGMFTKDVSASRRYASEYEVLTALDAFGLAAYLIDAHEQYADIFALPEMKKVPHMFM